MMEPGVGSGEPGLTDEDRSSMERYVRKSYLDRSPEDLLPSATDDPEDEEEGEEET